MKKLLELNSDILLTGRSRGRHLKGGIWDAAPGLNPFIENDNYRGVVAFGASPTQIGSAVFVDIPIAYTKKEDGASASNTLYILGSNAGATSGTIYSLAYDGTTYTATNLRTVTDPRNGIITWGPAAGSKLTYYALKGAIGTYDGTTFNDAAYSPGTNADDRPFHQLFGNFYYGNLNKIGAIKDDGTSTPAHTANVLDFEITQRVKAITDDGRYLAIGLTAIGSGISTAQNTSQVVFWDTNKSSWDWATPIPTTHSIRAMFNRGSIVYVVTAREVFTVVFGGTPKLLYSFDSDEEISLSSNKFTVFSNCVNNFKDGIIFGALGTTIAKPHPDYPRIVYNPINMGSAGNARLWITDFTENKVYFGTDNSQLWVADLTSAGAVFSGVTTRNFAFPRPVHIERLEIGLPNGIASGEHLNIYLIGDETSYLLKTINTANFPSSRFLSVPVGPQVSCSAVRFQFSGNSATAPSFNYLALWGHEKSI